ncbi:ankyrin repeat-containing domain protein [Chaetomidium leptoderma]|uniref:Ankyrin repeat-containing domain protein n=1 Tax=Chaetomidium leptoderma TaxID=669021 RepID=A0AAN6VHG9_9PEZI|nr:ankyrin repeat-containing domain protein [Chaetomidium leptoderma]
MAIVSMLLEANVDTEAMDAQGETPLSLAAANGREDVVRLLLDKNAKVDARGHNRHTAIASLLLDRGADVNTKDSSPNTPNLNFGMTPLLWATKNGDEALTTILLDKGAIIEAADDYRQHPLWVAIKSGHHSVVHRLFDHGACTVELWRQLGPEGIEPAAIMADASLLELLLRFDQGLPEDKRLYRLYSDPTALLCKSRCQSEAVVRFLLDFDADPNGYSDMQHRPLGYAAAVGNIAVIQLLLERGAEIEQRGKTGWTPLHRAVKYGHSDAVEALLARGADAAATWKEPGLTALDLAREGGDQEIIQLLTKALQARDQRAS